MPAFIHHIATAVPPAAYSQDFLQEKMIECFVGNKRAIDLIDRLFGHSGINRRHTVITDFVEGVQDHLLFYPDGTTRVPSTYERNAVYTQYAPRLAKEVGESLIANCPALRASDITHVITVSCTGFFAPGPEYVLVRDLGLARGTKRFHIGFMGCFAAFQALQMAKSFCEADPNATVLIVCLEICTIHLQLNDVPDNLVAASVFADGAAGAVIRATPPLSGQWGYRIDDFASAVLPEREQDMAWTLGDTGFEITLSKYVPSILQTNIRAYLDPLLRAVGVDIEGIVHWAIHPGGRAILDRIESTLGLAPEQVACSRRVLADFGNMSSATVLFVLKNLLELAGDAAEEAVVAMAFGPGLTIESALLAKIQA
ncbi:MAG: type III polyketide synthase [Gammaproteobacteria bacterium]|nr:type III polyketide synthase [Gammaproteobacteria bacterium]MCI0590465.1 type III polyketide synthase [Gammaproteobacteria bacterium]